MLQIIYILLYLSQEIAFFMIVFFLYLKGNISNECKFKQCISYFFKLKKKWFGALWKNMSDKLFDLQNAKSL